MKSKKLTKKTHDLTVITRWVKPENYNLSIVTLDEPALKLSLNLVYGTYEEFKKFIKKEYDTDIKFNGSHALVVQLDHEGINWNFMLITENNWTAIDYGTICHELHHFVHFGLEEKGVSYGTAGEEIYAYFQGYFMELVVRAFQELKRVKK